MQSLLLRSLKLTIPTALAFTLIGYAISVPMSFYLDIYAARWQFNPLDPPGANIQTERLDALRQFQIRVALGSAGLGVVVAQTTFVAHALAESDRSHES
ncbi:MAG: hypothetical protein HC879_13080 [Leptolyngbyaceae cyanobacterium SL_5_9]|nr:hypothetical protein [Leptolyngbyaceae cyanobacterium SL_5_9]NJO74227.1 hypothetical protein [Leptolyngbyaceae cyanobacterium RM1_406_9]